MPESARHWPLTHACILIHNKLVSCQCLILKTRCKIHHFNIKYNSSFKIFSGFPFQLLVSYLFKRPEILKTEKIDKINKRDKI